MITLNGRVCHAAELYVPWSGRWVARVRLDGAIPGGRASLQWGAAALEGRVEPTGTGAWLDEASVTLVGGLGWSTIPKAQWLQNDAGLTGAAVASALASAVGETLVIEAGALRPCRVSYARAKQAAATTLEDLLAPGKAWWVEFDGRTIAGTRSAAPVPPRVEVLRYHPAEGLADLDADDVGQVLVGGVIAARPPRVSRALRIVELRARAGAKGQRIRAAVVGAP